MEASGREVQFRCLTEGCGEVIQTLSPESTLINKPTFSLVVIPHETAVVCKKCGQAYGFVLRGIKGAEVGYFPVTVEKPAEPDIIIPPASFTEMMKKKGN